MVKVSQLSVALSLCLLGACSRTVDACPAGVREGDRCVADDPAEPSEEDRDRVERGTSFSRPGPSASERDVGIEQKPEDGDVSLPLDAGSSHEAGSALDASDGSLDVAAPVNVGPETGTMDRDANALDADATSSDGGDAGDAGASATDAADARQDASDASDASEAAVDSGEGDTSVPLACTDADLSSWRVFQTGGSLIQTIASCFGSEPSCASGACDLAACLRRAAGVGGCVACVAEETRCALTACSSACSSSDTSDACRACACRQGCIGGTSACGMGSVNACRDCRGTTCNNMSLDPALIMVIVDA